jgi:hypothetical protein
MNAATGLAAGLLGLALLAPVPARGQWQMSTADGKSTITVGVLAQLQGEALEAAGAGAYQGNLFARRFRVLAGGKFSDRLSFFAETDCPNMGRGTTTGAKGENTVVLQDLVLTYALHPQWRLDAGMLLVPISHNGTQSAASLLPVDYGPWSFLASDPTNSKAGRDYGVLARGFLLERRVEVRAGLFDGQRGTDSRAPFRGAGRIVVYPLEADSGLFYLGTSLGKRRIVGLGASVDGQREYRTWSVDLFVEHPVPGGDGVTVQADYTRFNGDVSFPALPRQDVLLVEAGYYVHAARLTPFVQYSTRDYDAPGRADESRLQAGVAWWGNGHKFNLKAAAARLARDGAADGAQFVLQWQVLMF